ncbi:hypothetical protein HY628_02200 [Candidatus Uhrbacteria bacterium]|nr:hypothetical protein [Candidatus Uhrbacteria bacterium]
MISRSIKNGLIGSLILLALYFAILSLLSGPAETVRQFKNSWYFIVSLALGFGLQVGLFSYLRQVVRRAPKGMLAASGTASTLAMISCCSHYLANLLPLLATSGLAALISQQQIKFFWFGLIFNLVGLAILTNRVRRFTRLQPI